MRLRTSRGSALALAAFTTVILIALAGAPAFSQTYTVLHSFGSGTDGANPVGMVIDGLYATQILGATEYGGASGYGTVFTLGQDGINGAWTYASTHSFSGADGSYPHFGPIDGYGTTYSGGKYGDGTLYEVNSAGGVTPNLYNFCAETACDDGSAPGAVVQGVTPGDTGLAILGVTDDGGAHGVGVLFDISESTHQEVSQYWLDFGGTGGLPSGSVVTLQNSAYESILYFAGSVGEDCQGRGGLYADCGGVFSWNTTTGAEGPLHLFATADGIDPIGGLAGVICFEVYTPALFGTTSLGGEYGWGTVFEITSAGEYKVLYSFTGGSDGGTPEGTLGIDARNFCDTGVPSAIYGTTTQGGIASGTSGSGTLWTLSGNPESFKVLHSFCSETGCADGATPTGWLPVEILDGNTYIHGTTMNGGAYGKGVAFRQTL